MPGERVQWEAPSAQHGSGVWACKEIIVFLAILLSTLLAAQFLPGYLGMPAGIVQERIMLVLLPVLLGYIGWTW